MKSAAAKYSENRAPKVRELHSYGKVNNKNTRVKSKKPITLVTTESAYVLVTQELGVRRLFSGN